MIQLTRTARSHCRWWQTIDPETADSDQATRARAMRRGLIGFILLVLLAGVLKPLSVHGQDLQPPPVSLQTATFAGGCFWCMVHPFEVIDGVISTISGYTGGSVANPTYEQVSAGGTGHRESVEVVFDPEKVSYQILLDVYWRNIDPFDDKGQFCDKGNQYCSAIFVANDEQKALAEASKRKLGAVRPADRHRYSPRGSVLPRRGIPPGLLQKESAALPGLPLQLRARCAPEAGVG